MSLLLLLPLTSILCEHQSEVDFRWSVRGRWPSRCVMMQRHCVSHSFPLPDCCDRNTGVCFRVWNCKSKMCVFGVIFVTRNHPNFRCLLLLHHGIIDAVQWKCFASVFRQQMTRNLSSELTWCGIHRSSVSEHAQWTMKSDTLPFLSFSTLSAVAVAIFSTPAPSLSLTKTDQCTFLSAATPKTFANESPLQFFSFYRIQHQEYSFWGIFTLFHYNW